MGADKWRRWLRAPIFLSACAAALESWDPASAGSFGGKVDTVPDRFASIDYGALVDWPARLAREWPFLERALSNLPSRRVLDLGSGPGEHARFLASHGFEVVGVDGSPSMIERARAAAGGSVDFVFGDLADLDRLVTGRFGGAMCLGNTLPSLRTADALGRMLRALRALLLPGGTVALQLLNYEKIFSTGQRHLPLTLRPTPDGTLVFVRLMDLRAGGDLIFVPTVLRCRPDANPPVSLEASERVEVHGWTRPELDELLEQAGFHEREYYGSVAFDPYLPAQSADLVVLVR
jgi:SAM-dependent methyltransferase